MPNFRFEKPLWQKGLKVVGGVDEVGRGAFAGPVVAAVVAFSSDLDLNLKLKNLNIKIDDSKKLSPKARVNADFWIKSNCLTYGIGQASVIEINKFGIVKATQKAFRRALENSSKVEYLLIDAFYIPFVKGIRKKNQLPIIKGDSKSKRPLEKVWAKF